MIPLRFKTDDGILHVHPREIAEVLEESSGWAQVLLHSGTKLRVPSASQFLATWNACEQTCKPDIKTVDERALMDMIFGAK